MVHNGRGGDVEHRTSDDVELSHARSVAQQQRRQHSQTAGEDGD
jgi:hypothetical protein